VNVALTIGMARRAIGHAARLSWRAVGLATTLSLAAIVGRVLLIDRVLKMRRHRSIAQAMGLRRCDLGIVTTTIAIRAMGWRVVGRVG